MTIFSKLFSSKDNELDQIKAEAWREIIRQSRLAFNIAAGVVAASAIMTLGGVGLLYFGKVSEATLTAGVGTIAAMTSIQYAKQTKDELLDMLKEAEENNS